MIRVPEVRLVGTTYKQAFILVQDAMKIAQSLELDLVRFPEPIHTVCKVIDYNKFLYDEKKKRRR